MKSIYDNIKKPTDKKEILGKQKELANTILPKLAKWVRESYKESKKLGLTKAEAKEVIKITFSLLGKVWID